MAYKEEVARRIALERKLEECQAEIADLNDKLETIVNAREADRTTTKRVLAQIQETSEAEIADLKDILQRENPEKTKERVKEEGRHTNDALTSE
eukprot:scaffold1756_cov239-Ochromonas_danica.AAC.2